MFAYNALTGEYIGHGPSPNTERSAKAASSRDICMWVWALLHVSDPNPLGSWQDAEMDTLLDAGPTAFEVLQFEEVGNMPNVGFRRSGLWRRRPGTGRIY